MSLYLQTKSISRAVSKPNVETGQACSFNLPTAMVTFWCGSSWRQRFSTSKYIAKSIRLCDTEFVRVTGLDCTQSLIPLPVWL